MGPEQVKALSTKDLVALYNRLTKKSIKKFSSRATGEKQVLAVLAKAPKPRKINGAAGSTAGSGRPKAAFEVKIAPTGGETILHKASLRKKLMVWLENREGKLATIDAIEKHFGRPMRGVVNKLKEKGWVKISAAAAA